MERSAVVLVIDRLGAGWLGPYGNTWLDAPNFNRLAARSVLFETVIAASPDLQETCRQYWTGRHVLEPSAATDAALPASFGRGVLLTDDRQVAEHPLALAFSEQQLFQQTEAKRNAESIEETDLFGFFEAAGELVAAADRPELIWLHSRGLSGAWDAPLEFRNHFADDDDPEPLAFVQPPERLLNAGFDPDEVLGLVQAYSGQVALVDQCLGMLLEALDGHPQADETLFIVTSPRGYPLGEHRRIGPCDQALYGELLQVPLLVQLPGREQALTRTHRIVQPRQIFNLLSADPKQVAELLADPRESLSAAHAIGPTQRAIRTPAWFLRESQTGGEPQYELFAKPDDRWEANEISSRCTDVVELLAAELDRFASAAAAGQLAESPPLAELLCDTWR